MTWDGTRERERKGGGRIGKGSLVYSFDPVSRKKYINFVVLKEPRTDVRA